MRRNASLLTICLVGGLVCGSGCSSLSKSSGTSSGKKLMSPSTWFAEDYQTPTSLAVIWSPDVLTTAGQGSQRGFGGRVFFYNERMQAVPVQGDLIVHGYDRSGAGSLDERTAADKTYTFSAEQLTEHFSPSQLGASYSIWVPWNEAGGFRQPVTLVATFKSSDDKVVQGTSAKLFLPGKNPAKREAAFSPMQTVSFQKNRRSTNPGFAKEATRGLRTTEISVPSHSSLTRRKNGRFTLGGAAAHQGQSVSTGAREAASRTQTSVQVGGRSRIATPQIPQNGSPAVAPAAMQPTLQIRGLGAPPALPSLPGTRNKVAGTPVQGVVPASFSFPAATGVR